jgi:hypothetical protein
MNSVTVFAGTEELIANTAPPYPRASSIPLLHFTVPETEIRFSASGVRIRTAGDASRVGETHEATPRLFAHRLAFRSPRAAAAVAYSWGASSAAPTPPAQGLPHQGLRLDAGRRLMTKRPTPEIRALTTLERTLLFCVGSETERRRAGVMSETVTAPRCDRTPRDGYLQAASL